MCRSKNTTQRLWVRLVGRRHDLLLWKPDRRTVEKPCGRLYPSRLSSNERWILDAIKPLFDACRCPPEVFEVYLPDTTTQTNATFVRMCVVVKGNGKRSGGATTSNNDDDDIYNTIPPLVPLPMDDHFKELVVIRHPFPIVHVYDVMEHGRRYYRSQIFFQYATFLSYYTTSTI